MLSNFELASDLQKLFAGEICKTYQADSITSLKP
jgi:hypothetical protein